LEILTFERFTEFLRRWWRIPKVTVIASGTQFDRDLGITGDDGQDLLNATEREFGVRLSSEEHGYRETFNLAPNEYLFQSEGGAVWEPTTLFGTSIVRAFTVGELYEAVKRALRAKQRGIE
jgi:hypothetical protein